MSVSGGRIAGREPAIGLAPGDLRTLQAFVNTLDIEQGTDALSSPADLDDWLRRAGLVTAPGDPAGQQELSLAIELREALRDVLRSHVTRRTAPGKQSQLAASRATDSQAAALHDSDDGAAGARVGRVAAAMRAGIDVGADGDSDDGAAGARVGRVAAAMRAGIDVGADGRIRIVAAGAGAMAALTRLLLIGAEAATAGTWTRLKVCSADDCQWAFYDRSPTHSGCWCSMQICGSRAKSRAYRSRSAGTG